MFSREVESGGRKSSSRLKDLEMIHCCWGSTNGWNEKGKDDSLWKMCG